MNMTIGGKLALGFGVILTFLAILGGVVLMSMSRVSEQFKFVVLHDAPVIANAWQLEKLVVDMETGQRGFCLTLQDEFLAPYNNGVREFSRLIEIEKDLVSDNPSQVRALEKIEALVDDWQTKAARPEIEMARKIALRTVGADAMELVLGQEVGKGLMDNLRTLAERIDGKLRAAGMQRSQLELSRLIKALVDQETGQRGYIITGKAEFLAPYRKGQEEYARHLRKLRSLGQVSSRDLGDFERLAREWRQRAAGPEIAARVEMDKHPDTHKDIAALLVAGTGKAILDELRVQFDQFITVEQTLTSERYTKAAGTTTVARNSTAIIVVIALIFGVAVAYVLTRGITGPIRNLMNAADSVAKGDLMVELKPTSSDETGQLTLSFGQMVSSLKGIVSRVISDSAQILGSSQQMAANSQQASAGMGQIGSAIRQIAKGAETQAARVEDVTSAMAQLNATISQGAKAAEQAASGSTTASQAAQKGAETVRQAVEAMDRIDGATNSTAEAVTKLGKRSEQMETIVTVISDVADQTNLLALNAAIEAARAGEAGRGFAVVADEVRKLAENSARSASEIAQLIRETTKETQSAVESMETSTREAAAGKQLMSSAGKSLDDIQGATRSVASMLQQISAGSTQMALGATAVVKSVQEVATIAEEASASTQQASASSQQLVGTMQSVASAAQGLMELGSSLSGSVTEFKVDDGSPTSALTIERARVTARPRPMGERLAEARKKIDGSRGNGRGDKRMAVPGAPAPAQARNVREEAV